MILKLSSLYPSLKQIQRIVQILQNDGIISYPTDTLYAIGCSAESPKAVSLLNKIKHTKENKPKEYSIIVSSLQEISKYAIVNNRNFLILKNNLPGPYTFILPAKKSLPSALFRKNKKTIGIRIPNNYIAIEIVKELNCPLITTSVTDEKGSNISDPYEIEKKFRQYLDIIIDDGELHNIQGTVVDLTQEEPVIVREGEGIDRLQLFY